MLGSAHRAVVLRHPATSAVLSAVFARATLPSPSAPVARSPSSPHAPTPCVPPSQVAHRPPPLDRGDRGGGGGGGWGARRGRMPWVAPPALAAEQRHPRRIAASRGLARRQREPVAGLSGGRTGDGEGGGVARRWSVRSIDGGEQGRGVGEDPPALPAAFEGVQRWVVFSDLHVSRGNAELCAALLSHVHQLTKDRCIRQCSRLS
ncbi:unnamed protein product [Closterium sp. NIES-65]|nr:unnamed protein product [Closterium sp. NIES-65]